MPVELDQLGGRLGTTEGWRSRELDLMRIEPLHLKDIMATCPLCRRGSPRIMAAIPHASVLTRILRHLQLASVPPPIAPARCRQEIFAFASASVDASSMDPDGDPITRTQMPAGPYNLGAIPVTLTVMDNKGASASCAATVTVVDQQPPTLTCPPSLTAEATGPQGATVPFTVTAADNCPGTLTPNCTPSAGSTFPLGSTPVSCLTIDGSTNQSTCGFTVTVVDTTPPSLTCPAAINRTVGQAVSLGTPTVADLVDLHPVVTNNAPATFSPGLTTVTWTARDAGGNTSTCTQKVTLLYNFSGFFQPVDNLPTLNVGTAGKAIPVKFSLGGNQGLNIFAAGSPTSQRIPCDSTAPSDDLEVTVTAGSSSLTYDTSTGQYSYIWKTENAWAGTCRQLVMQLKDGTEHKANFKFK